MGLAETAQLITELKLKDELGPGLAKATGEVQGYDKATASATQKTHSFTRAQAGATQAAGHFKSRLGDIGKLVGGAGLLGGGLALAAFTKDAVSKAEEWGRITDKLVQITGAGTAEVSRFVDAFDKLGVSGDTQTRIIGFMSKTLGNFQGNLTAAKKVQKDFGFSVLDSNHHVKTSFQVIRDFTDYFQNKHIPATQKAALGAKLFGRGWTDLIPVFEQGGRKMDAAMKGAMTMSDQNRKDLMKWRDAQRELNDSTGDLGVKVGLILVPALTKLAQGITQFVDQNGPEIENVFKGIVRGAEDFGGMVVHTVIPTLRDFAGAAMGFWNTIPGPLKDLLIKGFIADRAMKFMFGFSITGLAAGAIKDAVGGGIKATMDRLMGRGSPTNPMYVVAEGGGMGGGAGGVAGSAAAGGGGLGGKIMGAVKIAGAVTIAAGSIMEMFGAIDTFSKGLHQDQVDLQAKADGAANQRADDAAANLKNLTGKLDSLQGLDRILSDTAGGKQNMDALQNLTHAIVTNGKVKDVTTAINTMRRAQQIALEKGNQTVADAIGADMDTLYSREKADSIRREQAISQGLADITGHTAKGATQAIRLTKVLEAERADVKAGTATVSKHVRHLQAAEIKALDDGNTKLAHRYDAALKREQAKATAKATSDAAKMKQAIDATKARINALFSPLGIIAAKDTSVTVNTSVTSTIGVRSLESAQSVVRRYGSQQAF